MPHLTSAECIFFTKALETLDICWTIKQILVNVKTEIIKNMLSDHLRLKLQTIQNIFKYPNVWKLVTHFYINCESKKSKWKLEKISTES